VEMNRKGEKPITLSDETKAKEQQGPVDLLAGADISRFDKSKHRKGRSGRQGNKENRHRNGGRRREDGQKKRDA